MNLDSVYIALPSQSPAEIKEWWDTYLRLVPTGDREQFFQWLFEEKHITDLQYWDALNGSDMILVLQTRIQKYRTPLIILLQSWALEQWERSTLFVKDFYVEKWP